MKLTLKKVLTIALWIAFPWFMLLWHCKSIVLKNTSFILGLKRTLGAVILREFCIVLLLVLFMVTFGILRMNAVAISVPISIYILRLVYILRKR